MVFRVGLAGAGGIAGAHAAALTALEGVRLAHVFDADPSRAATLAASHGAEPVGSLERLIETCDAVFVCTWTAAHREIVQQVVAAGRPVFCEKPLAPTAAEARQMTDAVCSSGVVNQVGLPLRFKPGFAVLRRLLADPANGRVLTATMHVQMGNRGKALSGWRRDARLAGGGMLLEVGFHDMDLLEWLVGPARSVAAYSCPGQYPGIEDAATVALQYAGGATGSLVAVWHEAPAVGPSRRLHVVCEHAQYVVEGGTVLHIAGQEQALQGEALRARARELSVPVNPHAAFVGAVTQNAAATPDFTEAMRTHVLIDAAYRSARDSGAAVPVTD